MVNAKPNPETAQWVAALVHVTVVSNLALMVTAILICWLTDSPAGLIVLLFLSTVVTPTAATALEKDKALLLDAVTRAAKDYRAIAARLNAEMPGAFPKSTKEANETADYLEFVLKQAKK